MSVLILPQRFAQQPQQAAPVDTGHPLARRLVSYQPMSRRPGADAVDGAVWTVVESGSPFTLDAGPRGRGMRVKGATPSYIWRPVPASITASSTQPISFRFRLVFFSIGSTNTALMSWGSTPQDGTPRFYMRLNGAGQLEFFFSGGYHSDFIVSVVAGREYIFEWDFDGATHRGKLNGVPLPGSSASGWGGNSASFYLGMGFDGANASTDFLISDFAMWSRSRSTQESASDTQNPWQMLKAPPRRLWLASASAPANATGALAATLANATLAASGAVVNAGAFAATLSAATMTASGTVGAAPSGALASTLGAATMTAAGAVTNTGSFATTLGGASMAAAGTIDNRGVMAATLGGATMAAAGAVAPNVTGTMSSTLAGATMTAYGYNGVPPVLAGFFQRLPKTPRHVQKLP